MFPPPRAVVGCIWPYLKFMMWQAWQYLHINVGILLLLASLKSCFRMSGPCILVSSIQKGGKPRESFFFGFLFCFNDVANLTILENPPDALPDHPCLVHRSISFMSVLRTTSTRLFFVLFLPVWRQFTESLSRSVYLFFSHYTTVQQSWWHRRVHGCQGHKGVGERIPMLAVLSHSTGCNSIHSLLTCSHGVVLSWLRVYFPCEGAFLYVG